MSLNPEVCSKSQRLGVDDGCQAVDAPDLLGQHLNICLRSNEVGLVDDDAVGEGHLWTNVHTQRTQYSLIKEYTLNHNIKDPIVQGIFPN